MPVNKKSPTLDFMMDMEHFHSQISSISYTFQNGTSEDGKINLARDTRILRHTYELLRNTATERGYMTVKYHRGMIKSRMNEIRACLCEAVKSARPYLGCKNKKLDKRI